MYQIVELLVPLSFFATAFGIVYIAITAHNRKQLAMIEAGMNPNNSKKTGSEHSKIRGGLLLTLVPFGIFLGKMTASYTPIRGQELALIFAFLFGGVALVLSYVIEKRLKNKQTELLD
jgi:hypothetical protein